jgi:hydroxymethylpyrimidine pyrophosphatase-like HAD family hydrolase
MIRLIAIDVDGTLLDTRGQIPQANIDAIHDAVRAGIRIALVTGRSYPFARPIADPLPDSITLIVSNGAVERDMDGSRVAQRLLDRQIARAVLDSTRLFRESAALVFDRDADRQVMFNGGVEGMRSLYCSLHAQASGFAVSLTEYVHRDFSLIDVTAPTATKGRALGWRTAELGLSREQVMAIGDNFNDLEMLEFAGLPVVMANSVDGLKQRGWAMTGDNESAGVAEAIRMFALANN